jgi:hypothetical protein
LVAIGIVLLATCYTQTCPQSADTSVTIGGDTIDGYVSLQHTPLKSAQVRLRSGGKMTWSVRPKTMAPSTFMIFGAAFTHSL